MVQPKKFPPYLTAEEVRHLVAVCRRETALSREVRINRE
jgi:hypothetical protein